MTIDLFSIPAHISDSVIQKFELSHFRKFHISSQKAFDASTNIKTKFLIENRMQMGPLPYLNGPNEQYRVDFSYDNQILQTYVYKLYNSGSTWNSFKPLFQTDILNFPLRFEDACGNIDNSLTDEYCSAITDFFYNTNCSMDDVTLSGKIDCSPEQLRELVEIGKFKHMRVVGLLSPQFLEIRAIKNIVDLVIQEFMEETEIIDLDITMFDIFSSNLTSSGINLILKELLSGKRMIKKCTICTDQQLDAKIMFEGIPIATTKNAYGAEKQTSFFGGTRVYDVCYTNRFIQIR